MLIKEKVNDLIELGYDSDVIANALGISTSELERIKKQIEIDRNKRNSSKNQKTKLQLLRERYIKIYNTSTQPSNEKKEVRKPLSEEQIEETTKRLDIIEEKMQKVFNMSVLKQKDEISEIIKLYSYMDKLDLPVNLAQRAYDILSEDNLFKIKNKEAKLKLQKKIAQYRTKYIDTLNYEIDNSNDIDRLNILLKILTPISKESMLAFFSIKSKINKKIEELKLIKNKESLSISSESIENIIDLLMKPNFDIEKINQMIEQNGLEYFEKRKKFIEETAPNKAFTKLKALTIEGSVREVIHQIINTIKNRKVEISNLEELYQRLLTIGVDKGVAINTIVENLLKRSKFDEADSFVLKSYDKSKEQADIKSLIRYRNRIRNAQICDFIMKGINAPEGSIKDEDKYYQMIQSGIDRAKIDPQMLVLGDTRDGKKKITWADIMKKTELAIEI